MERREGTKEVTIKTSDVLSALRLHLSIIGKRLKSKDGSPNMSTITLSTKEEPIVKHYVSASADVFAGELAPLLAHTSGSLGEVTFVVGSGMWTDATAASFARDFIGYSVAYVASALLGMYYPDASQKYATDMKLHLDAARKLAYMCGEPHITDATVSDMKGAMYNDNGVLFDGTNQTT